MKLQAEVQNETSNSRGADSLREMPKKTSTQAAWHKGALGGLVLALLIHTHNPKDSGSSRREPTQRGLVACTVLFIIRARGPDPPAYYPVSHQGQRS